jgi:hypothetical protein
MSLMPWLGRFAVSNGTAAPGSASAEESAMATLLRAADSNTFRSTKEAILMCMLIRAVRRPPHGGRRSSFIVVSLLASYVAAHWHIWSLLLRLMH